MSLSSGKGELSMGDKPSCFLLLFLRLVTDFDWGHRDDREGDGDFETNCLFLDDDFDPHEDLDL